jgi:SPP1 gp7 family putative phage head morphogenesis protein
MEALPLKTLPPQHLKDHDWQDVEGQLKAIFYEILFAPLAAILRKASPQMKELKELLNASGVPTSLLVAIRSGRIQYALGVFSGDFSVAISKDLRAMGATFDHRSSVYRIEVAHIPPSVRAEAAAYQQNAKSVHEEIKRKLDEIQKGLDRIVEAQDIDADETLKRIESGFKKSSQLLEVQPKITEDHKRALVSDYNKNVKLYIKDFSKQSIGSLREAVEKNAQEGYRFDKLQETIRHRYGVTANKAKFLARQETSLFMAKFRKQRFDQAGVRRYRWSTSNDERVRDSHKHLNGRVFGYDQPPITDRSTGAKNNPGEDFNCRCVDIPLLEYEGAFAGQIH